MLSLARIRKPLCHSRRRFRTAAVVERRSRHDGCFTRMVRPSQCVDGVPSEIRTLVNQNAVGEANKASPYVHVWRNGAAVVCATATVVPCKLKSRSPAYNILSATQFGLSPPAHETSQMHI